MSDLLRALEPVLDWLVWAWDKIDVKAIGAIVGPLAAAYFGAYSAQRIIERRETRQKLLKEIRSCNVGATLAFSIANTFLNIKGQHVKALHESYHSSKKAAVEAKKTKVPPGQPRPVFELKADLAFLSPPVVPVEQLQHVVADEISVTGRPLVLPAMIAQTVRSQAESLELRNSLIRSFRAKQLSHDEFADLFFGFPTARGVDNTYGATIDAIYKYTDDVIQFSVLLNKDLAAHGKELQRRYKQQFKDAPPIVVSADFTKAEKNGLMPPEAEYADWESMFKTSTSGQPKNGRFWNRRNRSNTSKGNQANGESGPSE